MTIELLYFTPEYAVKTHQKIIDISGGINGIKSPDYIESPLHHIQNDEYYPTFETKLTHLVFSLNKFHAFNDGNKRTSIALGAFFMMVNGLDVFADKFIIEMENIAVVVADNLIDKELLQEIIFSIINDKEYSEELKIKIIDSLSRADEQAQELNLGSEFYKDLF
jgi:death-on-curing protein